MARRMQSLAVAQLLALGAAFGSDLSIPSPRTGTIPNPGRQTKAEKKRAKRAARNLALTTKDTP